LDSFVASGEFRSRSELMREALRAFLKERALSGAMVPGAAESVTVSLQIRPDEVATFAAYGEIVENGAKLPAVMAGLVRRGALELKVADLVASARQSVRKSAEVRQQLSELQRAGAELSRKGVVGR
jgi:Arc/MetJ-type ribon-helix-helix transcriptional regulator